MKLPPNASEERGGTHAELRQRAERLDKASRKMLELHRRRDQDGGDEGGSARLSSGASRRCKRKPRRRATSSRASSNAAITRARELKSNVTDNDSAKMAATSKGVILGYAAQAAVDASHQVIVAVDVSGSGSEQAMLLPMIEQARGVRAAHTVFTADAGYHSQDNIDALKQAGIPAMVADGEMRKRDERLAGQARHKGKPDPLHDKAPGAARPLRL